MTLTKRTNYSDAHIKIRIIKALGAIKPVGIHKHFYLVKILRNMKKPNIITADNIWTFLNTTFPVEKFDEEDFDRIFDNKMSFDKNFEPYKPFKMIDNNITVHPLVMASVVDHYRRCDSKRVAGIVMGKMDERLFVTKSYAVPFSEDDKGNWFFDTSYSDKMYALLNKVDSSEKILGWYHSGPSLHKNDLDITKSFMRDLPNPLLVIVDVKAFNISEQVQIFRLVDDKSGKKNDKKFKYIPCVVEGEEAEEVGVEHLLKDIRDCSVSKYFTNVKDIKSSMEMYEKSLTVIVEYLQKVKNNEIRVDQKILRYLQKCLNEVPIVSEDDDESKMALFTSLLANAVVKITDLVLSRKESVSEEDGIKTQNKKNNTPLISQGGTTLEEPTNNINEESDLEEETVLVKEVEDNILKW
ncbi:regulatory subunit of 26S proteasome [Hamiltosporidium magnivora]|uniref:Regulatory subunit of 26S proteasome n=1 Tax=Hamiltosporidium magnivora TaxID=148818 RepID=A0A4Q9LCN5_9MICR|nr:regulatory subunit of 26S proteasome [Hamiltosporidium magnivora]